MIKSSKIKKVLIIAIILLVIDIFIYIYLSLGYKIFYFTPLWALNVKYIENSPVQHGNIYLPNQTSFDEYFLGDGKSGDSWDDAHLIENYNISSSMKIDGYDNTQTYYDPENKVVPISEVYSNIFINNSNEYLTIKNCVFNFKSEYSQSIILLVNCSNILIQNCFIDNPNSLNENDVGIDLVNCSNIHIKHSRIIDVRIQIRCISSNLINISNNLQYHSSYNGVSIGIMFFGTDHSLIDNNHFFQLSTGISTQISSDDKITSNKFEAMVGIFYIGVDCQNIDILYNQFFECYQIFKFPNSPANFSSNRIVQIHQIFVIILSIVNFFLIGSIVYIRKIELKRLFESRMEKKRPGEFWIFISYAIVDRDLFRIQDINRILEKNYSSTKVIYFEDLDVKFEDIIEFMNKFIEDSDIFLILCSNTSIMSENVNRELNAALYLKKPIIYIFLDEIDIPSQLTNNSLGIKYDGNNFDNTIFQLNQLIQKYRK